MTQPDGVELHQTQSGARIYRIPLEVFPDFWGFAHLVVTDGYRVLVDVGSGFGDSNHQLEAGLESVRREHGESVDWTQLTHILITHGHMDHFGGLPYVLERTQAPVGVHELDLKVLTGFEERLTIVTDRLENYLRRAGVPEGKRAAIMRLYTLNKHLFTSIKVDFTYEAAGMAVGPFKMIHTPGHCPGHVVLLLDDVLLTGDHILPGISPHQSPEWLSLSAGLGHYLDSLDRVLSVSEQNHLGLGGHGPAFRDVPGRIMELKEFHLRRLKKIADLAEEPLTVNELAEALFPGVEGYDLLLSIEEAGAHVEYLALRGYLSVDNAEETVGAAGSPARYRLTRPFAVESLQSSTHRGVPESEGRTSDAG